MSEVEGSPRPRSRLFPAFVAALGVLTIVFFVVELRQANRTTLRGDEVWTVFQIRNDLTLGRLLRQGAAPQVSPAPMLYIVDMAVDAARAKLNYLGLTPPGYVRLPTILFSASLGFAAALVVGLRIRRQEGGGDPLRFFLVLCGLAAYFFQPKVFVYAGLERPYGLWNGLWLFLLAWLLGRPPAPKAPLLILCLMAAAATASCFQILALGIALLVVRLVEKQHPVRTLKEGALLLALPAAIGVFYALRSVDASYDQSEYVEKVPGFARFWLLSNLHVWIAGGLMTFLALKKPALRPFALPPVALTALILLMPLAFTLAHLKGYSTVSRQYIWTSTALPLACFFAAVAWPELKPNRYLRGIATVASLAIVGGNLYATSKRELRNDSRELTLLERGGPLMTLLQTKCPKTLLCPDEVGNTEWMNVMLIADWIEYRTAALPEGEETILVQDERGRLVAEVLAPAWKRDFKKGVRSLPLR